jgi:uncharacterized protein YdhG (YjbR/CyaY superfamily)
MKEEKIKILTVDEYIDQFEEKTKQKLIQLRNAIQEAAPDASEKIAWSMPLYNQNGFLIQFAAHKKHIGFYCSQSAIASFKEELIHYKTNEKNTIQFLLDKELPLELVKRIVQFRIEENSNNAFKK